MMVTMNQWIKYYNMEGHREGGFYYQNLKSNQTIVNEEGNERALYTSIYFLLTDTNPSRFHRLKADEVWYYHYGQALIVHMITPEGNYETITLGSNIERGEVLQAVVPKGTIFGSTIETEDSYALVSCMVSPGFEYEDFELFQRDDLLSKYPEHHDIIERLTLN
ncbi:cupin domain-containing protein [Aerococcaceae bacterium WGS1372]